MTISSTNRGRKSGKDCRQPTRRSLYKARKDLPTRLYRTREKPCQQISFKVVEPFKLCTAALDQVEGGPHVRDRMLDASLHKHVDDNIPNKKATRPDAIPNELLRQMLHFLKSAVRDMCTLMRITGHTPDSWKHSNTELCYKKGHAGYLCSYRPTSSPTASQSSLTHILSQ